MQIANQFALSVPIDEAWPLLCDLSRVAPLMPGVRVDAADAEGMDAEMRVKVGPVTASYKLRVTTESLDAATHTAVLRAQGRELRGQGSVDAVVTAVLAADGDRTAVELQTALDVTGRVAQLGGSVMKEVADAMLRQFADQLASELVETRVPTTAVEPEPVDIGKLAGAAIAPRLVAPALVAAIAAALLAVLLRRRHR